MRAKKPPQPTPTQAEALRTIVEHGGIIERWKGGFWTYPGCKVKYVIDRDIVPVWHTHTQTVQAMIKRGWLERCHKHEQSYRDDYRLTEAGRAAIGLRPPIAPCAPSGRRSRRRRSTRLS